MFQTLGAFAEFERNIIAEHIKAGLRTAKLKGHKLGRKIGPEGSSRGTSGDGGKCSHGPITSSLVLGFTPYPSHALACVLFGAMPP